MTACKNAAEFIDNTLQSVLNQNYPDLEYIVVDGGSTDGTQQIIEPYLDRLAYYVSEPDGGQYEAIQRGLARATGDVMCWLNADDIFMPWTLSVVGEIFKVNSDVNWITGLPTFINRGGQITSIYGSIGSYPQTFIANGWFNRNLGGFLQQENMFWRSNLWEMVGGFNPDLCLAADYALWTNFALHSELVPVSVPLSAFRKLPGEQRSSIAANEYGAEVALVMTNLPPPPVLWRWVANRGLLARSLARVLIRRRAPAILYDEEAGTWRKIFTHRPISRMNLRELAQLYAMRCKTKKASNDL